MSKETIKVQVVKIPYFMGSDKLKNLITTIAEPDNGSKGFSEYPLDNIEDFLEEIESTEEIKKELETLAKEIKERGFDYIRIEH